MVRKIPVLVILVLILSAFPVLAGSSEKEKTAVISAEKWLGMVDSDKTSLPGAPDGEYVVIEFESSFEHKKSAIETVTPMNDKDGKWRVSGYYIK